MTRSNRLLGWSAGRMLIPAGALLILAATGGGASAQPAAGPAVSEAVQREVQLAQDQLARASAEFEGPQQSRSIVLLDEVILRLEGVQRQGPLPPRGRDLLAQAYELRGRAYFTIGLSRRRPPRISACSSSSSRTTRSPRRRSRRKSSTSSTW